MKHEKFKQGSRKIVNEATVSCPSCYALFDKRDGVRCHKCGMVYHADNDMWEEIEQPEEKKDEPKERKDWLDEMLDEALGDDNDEDDDEDDEDDEA